MSEKFWDGEIDPTEIGEPVLPETGIRYGIAEKPHLGQDFIYTDHQRGVYAVFDGMGGVGSSEAGKNASYHAAAMCSGMYKNVGTGVGNDIAAEKKYMVDWMEHADRTMFHAVGEAGTTATAVRVVNEGGEKHIVWASVGDSRLYLYRDGELSLLSTDESHDGRALYNCLGIGVARVNQVGDFKLKSQDRLMLCSDGITGDKDDELLDDWEIIEALSKKNPNDSAAELIRRSRKRDDKSVVVIDFMNDQVESPKRRSPELEQMLLYEYDLGPREVFRLDADKPIENRGGYSVTALIKAAKTELMLLDLRNTPQDEDGRRRAFGKTGGGWHADFLLVDDSFADYIEDPQKAPAGYKDIRPGNKILVGREHGPDTFDLSETVSRKHFRIDYDKQTNNITIVNQAPTNGTSVKVSRDIFTS